MTVQWVSRGGINGEGDGGRSVHGDVDLEQLNSSWYGLLFGGRNGRGECDDDGGGIGRGLELQKLTNGVVDTTAPHDSLGDISGVVIC